MIIRHKQRAICPTWFEDEVHQPHDPLRTFEESLVVTQETHDATTHIHLKSDLLKIFGEIIEIIKSIKRMKTKTVLRMTMKNFCDLFNVI
jgi:lipoate synthase